MPYGYIHMINVNNKDDKIINIFWFKNDNNQKPHILKIKTKT